MVPLSAVTFATFSYAHDSLARKHLVFAAARCFRAPRGLQPRRGRHYRPSGPLGGHAPEEIEDRHFHTFEPRQVRLTIRLNL